MSQKNNIVAPVPKADSCLALMSFEIIRIFLNFLQFSPQKTSMKLFDFNWVQNRNCCPFMLQNFLSVVSSFLAFILHFDRQQTCRETLATTLPVIRLI